MEKLNNPTFGSSLEDAALEGRPVSAGVLTTKPFGTHRESSVEALGAACPSDNEQAPLTLIMVEEARERRD